MRMRPIATGLFTAAALVVGIGAAALPASAATSGATTATFELTGGDIAITVPAAADLGTDTTGGGDITAALGDVTVTDERGALDASWDGSVISTSFTTGGGTANETVAATAVSYWSGLATDEGGDATFDEGQATAGDAVAINASTPAFSTGDAVGNNNVTWGPTLIVAVGADNVVGTYTGTVTHSVV